MALITTIDELKQYLALEDNVKIETLQPFINEAELLFITDLLGSAFYAEFLTAYTASVASTPTPLSDDNKALLPFIQRCLAYYAMVQALPQLATTVGDMGVRQYKANGSDPAPQWLLEKLQFNNLKSADLHAEKLLEYLELNATSSKYATWFNSPANTQKYSGYLVRSAQIASKYIDISQSRRLFLKLRQKFQEIETRWLPKWVGDAQYAEFITQIKANTINATNQKLIDKITAIVCKMGLHIQLPFIRVSIQSDGLWLYSEPAMTLRDRWFMAEESQIEELCCALKDGEMGYLKDQEALRQFILAHIDDYPLIKASSIYTVQPTTATWQPPDNHWNNKHFVV